MIWKKAEDYIIRILSEAIEVIREEPSQEEPADISSPSIMSPSETALTEEQESELSKYIDKALMVEDFEGFLELLQHIADREGYNQAKDLDLLASFFNRERIAQNLDPL